MKTCRALIAEDEQPQREALVAALRLAWPTLEISAVCEDGIAALEAVQDRCPDVAFLDIRMPGVNGLQVAREVAAGGGLVVFTTAYDRYAVAAFETGAVDYLLKPIDSVRLQAALDRVRARLQQRQRPDLDALLAHLETSLRGPESETIRWISASVGDALKMIAIDEVLYFRADDKYVSVVTRDDEAIIRTPLKELVGRLDPDTFWQVHRSVVVRVAAIDRARKDELGRLRLHLRGRNETLPVSRAFQQRFRGM